MRFSRKRPPKKYAFADRFPVKKRNKGPIFEFSAEISMDSIHSLIICSIFPRNKFFDSAMRKYVLRSKDGFDPPACYMVGQVDTQIMVKNERQSKTWINFTDYF
jgi:hypothetical protein